MENLGLGKVVNELGKTDFNCSMCVCACVCVRERWSERGGSESNFISENSNTDKDLHMNVKSLLKIY